jgi:hypothetical protein
MWEVRAAEGRLDELVAYAIKNADPAAEIYAANDPARLVLIDPSGRGLPDVPAEFVGRTPNEWQFRKLAR